MSKKNNNILLCPVHRAETVSSNSRSPFESGGLQVHRRSVGLFTPVHQYHHPGKIIQSELPEGLIKTIIQNLYCVFAFVYLCLAAFLGRHQFVLWAGGKKWKKHWKGRERWQSQVRPSGQGNRWPQPLVIVSVTDIRHPTSHV